MQKPLPRWPSRDFSTECINSLPIQLATTSIDIHLCCSEPALTLPQETDSPEEEDDWNSEERLEEALCVVEIAIISWRGNGDEKLCDVLA